MAGTNDGIDLQVLLPSFDETFKAVFDFTVPDWIALAGTILWGIMLVWPLVGMDRRDVISGLTYAVFMGAMGLVLMVIIPDLLRGINSLNAMHIATMTVSSALAYTRWIWYRSRNKDTYRATRRMDTALAKEKP